MRDEYLRRLVDAAYVEIYCSGMDGARIYWPWRMLPVHEATDRYRNACERFIVDSAFNRPETTNKDTLDKANDVSAEFAVLADVYQDMEQTVEALVDGHGLYESHRFDGKIIYPLQAPHDECFIRLQERGINPDYVAIGGLKDAKTQRQIHAAQNLREVAGDGVCLHGLGWGLRKNGKHPNELVEALHNNPKLLDSIDYSTPAQMTTSPNYDIDTGEEMCSLQAAQIGTWLVRDLRRVTPFPDVNQDQSELQAFQ